MTTTDYKKPSHSFVAYHNKKPHRALSSFDDALEELAPRAITTNENEKKTKAQPKLTSLGSARISFDALNHSLFPSKNKALTHNKAAAAPDLEGESHSLAYKASRKSYRYQDELEAFDAEDNDPTASYYSDPNEDDSNKDYSIYEQDDDDSLIVEDGSCAQDAEKRGDVITYAATKDGIRDNAFIEQELAADESFILQPYDLKFINAQAEAPSYKKKLNSILQIAPPQDRLELCKRLNMLVGYSIEELALLANLRLPYQSTAGKGFTGQLIEIFLGAQASNLPLPDFINLNIELKTIPVGTDLMPQESTFLCVADLNREGFVSFERSALYKKIETILFVVVLAPKGSDIAKRRILGYFFFTPSGKTLELMREDYNELMGLVNEGRAQEINASMGNIIHMRPKAANAQELTAVRDQEGNMIQTRPRGYYLRRSFTKELMEQFIKEQGLTPEHISTLSTLI